MDRNEERLYEIAALELAERRAAPGLMAKAFSETEGDERKSFARYIQLRVRQLREEEKAAEAHARAQAKAAENVATQAEVGASNANTPRIIAVSCPKCGGEEGVVAPRGSWTHFFVLLCCFVVPGLLYALFMSGYITRCTSCSHVFRRTYV